MTLFGKPADQEDGGLVSQWTILPGFDVGFFYRVEEGEEVKLKKKMLSYCK